MPDDKMDLFDPLEVENAKPTLTDNGPRPEDGVQPTDAEALAILDALLTEDEEGGEDG